MFIIVLASRFTSCKAAPVLTMLTRILVMVLYVAAMHAARADCSGTEPFQVRRVAAGGDTAGEFFRYHSSVRPPVAVRTRVESTSILSIAWVESAFVIERPPLRDGTPAYDIGLELTKDGTALMRRSWEENAAAGRQLAVLVCGDLVATLLPLAVPEHPFRVGVRAYLSFEDAHARVEALNAAIERSARPVQRD